MRKHNFWIDIASQFIHAFTKPLLFYRHKTLSLKVTYIEFDFDVSDCTMQVVTHTSKIKMMPYNSVQMINSTLSFDVLLPRGTLMYGLPPYFKTKEPLR